MDRVDEIVSTLEMQPHPEGGFYKETYRSEEIIPKGSLQTVFSGDRNCATAIYFLLTSDNFSAFHKIRQDEVWHHYEGETIAVHVINTAGKYTRHLVGKDLERGAFPQLVVKAGDWFASSVVAEKGYALVGCTVAPGFDFEDFELAERTNLIQQYPEHTAVITRYTR